MSITTRRIAAVLGPTAIAVAASEAVHLEMWHAVDPTVVYLNGLVLFVAGVAILTNHRTWASLTQGLVSLSGWLLALAGLYRLFFPSAPQAGVGPATFAGLAVIGAMGLALTVGAIAGHGER